MTAAALARDRQVAEALGYSIYHYNDQHSYFQLWGADGNPVWDMGASGVRAAFPEFATEEEAWSLCPRFTESEDACREVRRFVYRQARPRIDSFMATLACGRPLPLAEVSLSAEVFLFHTRPSDIANAFLACHAAEPWVDVRGIGFGDFDDE